ncbi:MAG: 4Fe-4S ferredoxin [Aquificae bacterium]|nr:4Fe-4S ferredoxin [Aquificota bacterium]
MARLFFDIYSCVHTYYKPSSCSRCTDVCPIDGVISLENDKIQLNSDNCVSCGACVGICPTESFSLNGFDPKEFFDNFCDRKWDFVSCKLNVPCLASIDSQYLISLALKREEDIVLDMGHCDSCFIGKLKSRITEAVQEANYVLGKLEVPYEIKLENISYKPEKKEEPSRRSFLKKFTKTTASLAFWAVSPNLPINEQDQEIEQAPKNIVEEKVNPTKRKVLLDTLKEKQLDLKDKYVEVDKITFSSQKWIEWEKCTNCFICYNICPTGALDGGQDRLEILFKPSLCIKCRICHEVCPEQCLHLEEKLNLEDFVYKTKSLIQHVMIPCAECMVPFSYKNDGEYICPRCKKLDEEVKELLGL